MIKVENLSFIYSKGTFIETKALSNINFALHSGDSLGIIGETGSGKTTLIQLICGLMPYKEGRIYMDGNLVGTKSSVKKLRKKVGIVFQNTDYQFFCHTLKEELAFGLKNGNLSDSIIANRLNKIICELNIDPNWLSRSPFELSGGEKRKVAIASILVMEPQILILDEPTSGLDSVNRKQIIDLISKIKNITKIVISHNMDDICDLCNNVLVLKDGKQLYFGGIEKFFSNKTIVENSNLSMPEITSVMQYIIPEKIFIRTESAIYYLRNIKN